MYYQEAVFDGKTYFRTSPEGEWRLVSNEQLTSRIAELETLLREADNRLTNISESIQEYPERA